MSCICLLSSFKKTAVQCVHARKCHNLVTQVDEALHASNFHDLCGLINISDYHELIDGDESITLTDEKCHKSDEGFIALALPNLETRLKAVHACAIEEYNAKLKDDPEHVCVSCHRLLLRRNVTGFTFEVPKFNSDAWKRLKKFMLESTPDVKDKILYICDNCRCSLNSYALPAQFILNGLLTDPVPEELSKLNSLETQLSTC